MKSTTIIEGAFTIQISQNPERSEMVFDWALFLHDELLDADSNFLYAEALEDSNDALQEFVDEEFHGLANQIGA